MGASLSQSTKKGGRRQAYQPMSEINVTPFVDVILVLLIVFMVAAPLLNVGVPVELPESSAQALSDKLDPLVVSVNKQNKIYIQETEVSFDTLVHKLLEITKRNTSARIYLRGDHTLTYGHIMRIMGEINGAGFSKVALVSELATKTSKKKT